MQCKTIVSNYDQHRKPFLLQPHLFHSPRMVYWFLALSTLSSETYLVLRCWNRTERISDKSLYIYCSQTRLRSSVFTYYCSILPLLKDTWIKIGWHVAKKSYYRGSSHLMDRKIHKEGLGMEIHQVRVQGSIFVQDIFYKF